MIKILLIGNDRPLTSLLRSRLSQHYLVDVGTDEAAAWKLVRSQRYDLIVLDAELSDLNHVSLCQWLRESGSSALILLLNVQENHLVTNADDCISESVTPSEIEARIDNLLQRKFVAASVLKWGKLRLNLNTCEATFADIPLKLTAKEYAILELFLSNQQRIYSQSALLERLWSVEDLAAGENTVRTHIKRLRQKLKFAGAPELLETVYGLGYRLNEACRDSEQWRSPPSSTSKLHSGHSDQILRSSSAVITPAKATDAKVLILDDDLLTLRLLQAVLEPWGFQVTTLDHPQNFWDCLDQINPDLLVLDVQMPEMDGIELCQIIRNDRRWAWLPILFLTGSKDSETIQQIFAAGADDYASKPVVAAELIARILNRLERTRLLQTQAELDPLTGLLNRYFSSRAIEQQLYQAAQTQPFYLAILELQDFKRFNLQHGYQVGDRLLRQIAQILRQELQEDHIIAYWQCGEFLIGLRDVDCNCAIQHMQGILSALGCLTMDTAIEKIPISIATSVVQYPKDGVTLQELYRRAIETLAVEKLRICDRQFS